MASLKNHRHPEDENNISVGSLILLILLISYKVVLIMKFEVKNPNAAGIDVGSRFHCVSVGLRTEDKRTYGVFTEDLINLCEWLVSRDVKTVALESTGFYWKQLYTMIESYGMEAVLVNPQFTKNMRNRKPSDLADSQWIFKLHTTGLLPHSFQPVEDVEQIRTLTRHRKQIIEDSSRCVNKMQKSLILMNIQLSTVISDIMGVSGKAIVKAILSGERDAKALASLVKTKLKASPEEIRKSLVGFWKESHLFELQQNFEAYEFYRKQLEQCDQKLDELLQKMVVKNNQADLYFDQKDSKKKIRHLNAPKFKIENYAYQLSEGVNLLEIEGVSYDLLLTLATEVGIQAVTTKFETKKNFVSWLAICPNKKVSGGKVLSSKVGKGNKNLRSAFITAAVASSKVKGSYLQTYFYRMKSNSDGRTAKMATAKKIAEIVYSMLKNKTRYEPKRNVESQEKQKLSSIKKITKLMQKYGIEAKDVA